MTIANESLFEEETEQYFGAGAPTFHVVYHEFIHINHK